VYTTHQEHGARAPPRAPGTPTDGWLSSRFA